MHSFVFIATFQVENDEAGETEQSERKTEIAKGELISKSMVENWVQLLQVHVFHLDSFHILIHCIFLAVVL